MTNKTDPRQLESYLEQKETYEDGLEPEVERLVDSLQEWQNEADLQPRAGFVDELAQQLYEQERPPTAAPSVWSMLWRGLLDEGLKAAAAVAIIGLFAVWLLSLSGEPQSPGANPPVASTSAAITGRETASSEQPVTAEATASMGLAPTNTPTDICQDDAEHPDCVQLPPAIATTASIATSEEPDASLQADSCSAVSRPALLLGRDTSLDRLNLTVLNPLSGIHCTLSTSAYSPGALAVSADTLYYPRRDQDAATITIWEHPLDGEPAPLSFTTTPALSTPWFGLIVSADGRYLVWATFSDDTGDANDVRYRSTVWLGDLEAGTATLLWQEDAPDTLPPTIEPLYLSLAENVLYFARRPHGIGGRGPFPADYSSLYALPLEGGEPQPLFTCQTSFDFCLNDIDFERRLLATVANEGEQAELHIVAFDGTSVARYSPRGANYVGQPVFSPEGDVAFITANLERTDDGTPRFRPGAIRLLSTPYSGEPQTLLQETDAYFGLSHWFNDSHLVTGDWTDGQELTLLNLNGERIGIPQSGTANPITVLREPASSREE